MTGLMDEPPVTVQPSLIRALGLRDAVVLQQIHWRTAIADYHDTATRAEVADQIGLTKNQVARACETLSAKGLIVVFELDDGNPGMSKQTYEVDVEAVESFVAEMAESLATQKCVTATQKSVNRDADLRRSWRRSAKPSSLRDSEETGRDSDDVADAPGHPVKLTETELEALLICEEFAQELDVREVKHGDPHAKGWVTEMERLLRLDGRTPEQVRACIRWLFHSRSSEAEFWVGNVHSPKKLRHQYDKLRLAAQREKHQPPPKKSTMQKNLELIEATSAARKAAETKELTR